METVTKAKNEGRVASGKRLAEWNRKKKEDLIKNKTQVPNQVTASGNQVPNQVLSNYKVVGGLAVILLAVGGYVFFRNKQAPEPEKPKTAPELPVRKRIVL